jgi:hypothetical protein
MADHEENMRRVGGELHSVHHLFHDIANAEPLDPDDPVFEDLNACYMFLNEVRNELIAAECELDSTTANGRNDMRQILDDLDKVDRVRFLVEHIIDPREP